MAKRYKMSKKSSNRKFKSTVGTHPKNLKPIPMRGGFRL